MVNCSVTAKGNFLSVSGKNSKYTGKIAKITSYCLTWYLTPPTPTRVFSTLACSVAFSSKHILFCIACPALSGCYLLCGCHTADPTLPSWLSLAGCLFEAQAASSINASDPSLSHPPAHPPTSLCADFAASWEMWCKHPRGLQDQVHVILT